MKRSVLLTLLALMASLAVVGTALATHLPANPNVTTAAVRGTLADNVKYNVGDIKVQTKGPVDVVVVDVTFGPSASAGWHSHPGPVFVVIKTGTLSVWMDDCVKHTYSPGQSFFEAGSVSNMLVKNENATTAATVVATFIVPVGATPLRIGEPHLCGITE